jgi:hypothetical protein
MKNIKLAIDTYLKANYSTTPMYLEGETITAADEYITVSHIQRNRRRISTNNTVYYEGAVSILIYAKYSLRCHAIADALSAVLDEVQVKASDPQTEMDTSLIIGKAVKFADHDHYELQFEAPFRAWDFQ